MNYYLDNDKISVTVIFHMHLCICLMVYLQLYLSKHGQPGRNVTSSHAVLQVSARCMSLEFMIHTFIYVFTLTCWYF